MKKRFSLLLLPIAWASPAFANCGVFEKNQLLGENFRPSYIDHKAKEKWIAAQQPNHRGTARFIADNTKIFTQAEYEMAMVNGVRKLLSTIPADEPRALYLPTNSEGLLWNTRYAQVLLPELRSLQLISHQRAGDLIQKKNHQEKLHLIAIDDLAYSGLQLDHEVSNAERMLKSIKASTGNDPNVKFHFFRVAGTSLAKSKAEMSFTGPRDTSVFNISYGASIPTLQEMPGHPNDADLRPFTAHVGRPLTVPFFKTPDNFSYPKVVMLGEMAGDRYGRKIRFIYSPEELQGEPYRLSPFVDSPLSGMNEEALEEKR